MVRFGVTQFAGLASGIVTVAGIAIGSASALAEPTVFYRGAGSIVCESQGLGESLRETFSAGVAEVNSGANAHPKAFFYPSGTAISFSESQVNPLAYFYGQGSLEVTATAKAKAFKRSRVFPRIKALSEAIGLGESVVYSYGESKPAVGSSIGIGTTWHVVRAAVFGESLAVGDSVKTLGARQRAEGDSLGLARPHYQVSFSGLGIGSSDAYGDAAVRVNGVLNYAVNGKSISASETRLLNVSIYQPQRAVTDSIGLALAQQTRSFKGKAIGDSLGFGEAVVGITGVSKVVGESSAIGIGNASKRINTFAKGSVEAVSVSYSSAFYKAYGYGLVESLSYNAPSKTVNSGFTQVIAESLVTGAGIRNVFIDPVIAVCESEATGFNQVNDISKAPKERTVVVDSISRVFALGSENRVIFV